MTAMPLEAREPRRMGVVLQSALAVAGVGLFFTNADSYAYGVGSGPAPIQWVIAFAGAAACLVLVNLRRPMPLLRSPLLAWICLYFLVTTLWALWTPAFPEVIQELRDRYRSIVFLLVFAVLFDEPRARRAGVVAVAIAVAIAALVNVAEFLSLVTFPPEFAEGGRIPGRAAGLHINPNVAGLSIALGSAVAAPALPKRWRAPLLLVAALGVLPTFSRGATVCMALALLWLTARRALGGKWYVAAALICGLVVLQQAGSYVVTHDLLNENTSARVRLERNDGNRIALATKAWGLFASSPLIGNGVGSTVVWDATVQAHNMFVTLAADHGVLGLILFPALALALVASRRSAATYAIALMAAGFTNHGLLETRYALLLTALAGASARQRTTGAGAVDEEADVSDVSRAGDGSGIVRAS